MKAIHFFYVTLFLCCMSCNNRATEHVKTYSDSDIVTNRIVVKAEAKIWLDTVDQNIEWKVMGQYDKIPQLQFEEINKSQYLKYKKQYHPSFIQDSSMIAFKDSSFTIQTSKAKLNYVSEYNKKLGNRYGFSWTNYRGYIKPLHLYVMEGWYAGEFTFGDLFLIDSTANICYNLTSTSDYIFEIRALSPNNKYIVIEQFAPIEIGEIINTNGILSYKSIAYGKPYGSTLEEVIWINDHKIAIKTSTREDNPITKKMDEKIRYEVADIPLK